jgi:tripartite-type tricarboxylate transporter receptor subunit TctC
MNTLRRLLSRLVPRLLCLAVLGSTALWAHAESYPSKSIRMIVPYAAGQGTDIAARYVADALGKELNQPVYVENRAGAGGNIGAQLAARSAPDGYTLFVGTNATNAANFFLYSRPGYEPGDFEPVGMIGILPLVFVANAGSKINDVQGLIQAAKARPEKLDIAVSTTTSRLAYESLKRDAGVTMFPVDFKGSGEAVTAVIGGQLEFMVDTITSLRGAIQAKQVKALGITAAHASNLLPGVKSVAEQGVPGYELFGWTVVYAPKGVPAETTRVLSAALAKVLGKEAVRERLLGLGIDPVVKSGEELKAFGAAEKQKWGHLIRSAELPVN